MYLVIDDDECEKVSFFVFGPFSERLAQHEVKRLNDSKLLLIRSGNRQVLIKRWLHKTIF